MRRTGAGSGGAPPDRMRAKKLWRLMFERFTTHHGLTNLIWVSPGASIDLADWYPGDAYVDLIGGIITRWMAITARQRRFTMSCSPWVVEQKLVAMSENGPIPEPAAVAKKKWAGCSL